MERYWELTDAERDEIKKPLGKGGSQGADDLAIITGEAQRPGRLRI
jgi:hypothetical protein